MKSVFSSGNYGVGDIQNELQLDEYLMEGDELGSQVHTSVLLTYDHFLPFLELLKEYIYLFAR